MSQDARRSSQAATMIDLPEEAMVRVLLFLVGDDQSSSSINHHHKIPTVYTISNHRIAPIDRTDSNRIRRGFWCLAELRRVKKYWKQVLDGPHHGSKLWFQAAQALGLEPPPQLFYYTSSSSSPLSTNSKTDGHTTPPPPSYRYVCELLLKAEEEREQVIASARRIGGMKSMCRMVAPKPFPLHPNYRNENIITQQQARFVKLPFAVKERIAKNAMSLRSFLASIHYCLDRTTITDKERKKKRQKVAAARITEDDDDVDDDDDDDDDNNWDSECSEAHQQRNFDAQSALYRYRLFLLLKKSYPKIWLVPTADIEFCWLSHIFRTELYWKDMSVLEIDPKHPTHLTTYGEVATFSAAVRGTATLWEQTFGDGIPYLLPGTEISQDVWKQVDYGSKIGRCDPKTFFPVVGAPLNVSRTTNMTIDIPDIGLTVLDIQADLGWFPELELGFAQLRRHQHNVLAGSFLRRPRDAQAARDALLRYHLLPSYERFLNLCQSPSINEKDISPPYVLDLLWHAHQMEPVAYKTDCLTLFQREFLHHPWPKGLGTSVPVNEAFHCAWKTRYGTAMEEDWKLSIPGDYEVEDEKQEG